LGAFDEGADQVDFPREKRTEKRVRLREMKEEEILASAGEDKTSEATWADDPQFLNPKSQLRVGLLSIVRKKCPIETDLGLPISNHETVVGNAFPSVFPVNLWEAEISSPASRKASEGFISSPPLVSRIPDLW